jgi:hypothetical protein
MPSADHYRAQRQVLINGINAFEPVVMQLHEAYKREDFCDWPTIILATTVQTSAISLFKLLPFEKSREPLDKRSIASIIRNIVDSHDALDLLINPATPEQFNLHRDILGLYIAKRIATIQTKVDAPRAAEFYPRAASHYWRSIQNSRLYKKPMDRLKSGESIFYGTRGQRVEKACGSDAQFVMGVIADLSTYVHSVPPTLWLSDIDELYADNHRHRSVVGIWLRVANFYLARCFALVLGVFGAKQSAELTTFISNHKSVFAR